MFIVIEKHGGWEYAAIVTDEEGNNKVFNDYDKAEIESSECQDGIIVGDSIVEVEPFDKTEFGAKEEQMKYVIKELYNAYESGGTVTHIHDLIGNILGIEINGQS